MSLLIVSNHKVRLVNPTTRIVRLLALLLIVAGGPAFAAAARGPLSPADIDRLVARTMSAFEVPGVAVGIVKDGKLVFARGYGVRELGKTALVDPDTQFAIGSNTKAFTTAALAILVDAGKLHWDDKVIDYLPEFRMSDPYVTREFTIRDLLTHRSGLGLGAGDLMFVTPTDFTRHDLIHALRFLKPATSFRSQFAYDNLMYVVAGEVVAAVSGLSWEDFVTTRVLAPLGMNACAVSLERLADKSNLASPHAIVEGKLGNVARLEIPIVGPAGSIECSVAGMARWLTAQLARGKTASGAVLFSEAQSEEMWSAQTPLHPRGKLLELTHTHFAAYGLGWGLGDFDGYKRVSHNGGLPGMVTQVAMIPELNLGVVVLTNQQSDLALSAIAVPIMEGYAGAPHHDWVALLQTAKAERDKQQQASDLAGRPDPGAAKSVAKTDAGSYVGVFSDPWRGTATVARRGEGLALTFSHTNALSGPLVPLATDFFVVRWDDRSQNADAYVRFTRDFTGKVVGFTMQAESASTDFSFDFQDLDFSRVPDGATPAVN